MGTDPFRGHCLCSTRTHFPYCCTTSLLPAQENCWFVGLWITQRGKGSLVHLLTRDIGRSWTIFSVLLQDRAAWCSMLFSAPKCVTRHWQRALSRNIPAWTTQCLSLSHLVGGMCPSCSIMSRTGTAMLRTSVGGAGVTGEEHESESQISLALQRDPVLCVALRSQLGAPSPVLCQSHSQTQLFMHNSN